MLKLVAKDLCCLLLFAALNCGILPNLRITANTALVCDPTLLVEHRLKSGRIPASVAVGDFNGDRNSDLVVANSGSDNISVFQGDGKGNFGEPTNVDTGLSPSAVVVADFNSDS